MRTELDIEVGDLEKEDILASSDREQLLRWRTALWDIVDDVETKIEAYKFAGTAHDDGDWLRRAAGKVSCSRRAIRWIDRRCVDLGIETPLPPEHRFAQIIQRLQAQVHDENKGETRRIVAFLKEEYPNSDRVAEAVRRIGAGEHRRQDNAA